MYNKEHYRDTTAGLALRKIASEERHQNHGDHVTHTAPGPVVMVPVRRGKSIFMDRRQAPKISH